MSSFNVNSTEFPLRNFHATPRATIGWGAYRMAGEEAKAIGIRNALIVSSGLKGTGIVDEIAGVLRAADIAVPACPAPNWSWALSSRLRKPDIPSVCRNVGKASFRPVRSFQA